MLARESNLKSIVAFDRALLVFAGTEDFVTPPTMARALVDAAKGASSKELVTIEGGEHNGLYDYKTYTAGLPQVARAYLLTLLVLGAGGLYADKFPRLSER